MLYSSCGMRITSMTGKLPPRASASMNRRDFLRKAAGSAAAVLITKHAYAQNAAEARVIVAYEHPGQPVTADFTGLSYETSVLAKPDYFGEASYFSPDNRS